MLSRRCRIAVTGSMSLALWAGMAPVADAGDGWSNADCSQNPTPGCELHVGTGGDQPAPAPNAPSHGGSTEEPSADEPAQGDEIVGEDSRADCYYVRSDYQPPRDGEVIGASLRLAAGPGDVPEGEPGAWYVYRCFGPGWADALYRPPIWIPDGEEAAGPSPAQLAQQAAAQLRLPQLPISTSPQRGLVGLPTWWWVDRSRWRPETATASVPGLSVTVTATPTRIDFATGDGGRERCGGPGTPFGGDPAAASPDCGHTYRRASQGEPGGHYSVAATVRWALTWSGGGQSGQLPELTTTTRDDLQVRESQALNTHDH